MEVSPDPDGLYPSSAFPGLWLDPQALLKDDMHRVIEVLERGLARPNTRNFIHRLTVARS